MTLANSPNEGSETCFETMEDAISFWTEKALPIINKNLQCAKDAIMVRNRLEVTDSQVSFNINSHLFNSLVVAIIRKNEDSLFELTTAGKNLIENKGVFPSDDGCSYLPGCEPDGNTEGDETCICIQEIFAGAFAPKIWEEDDYDEDWDDDPL